MEIASGLLSSASQLALGPICQQLSYIRNLRENEETMQSEWRTLRSEKNDICENLNTGQLRYGKRPKEIVTDWLEKVEKIEKRVHSLGSGGANHRCFKGFCPNYYSHLKRSKKIVEILREVRDLQEKGKSFAQEESLFIDSLPETSSSLPATTLHGTSAERKQEEILQCIMNPEVSKVGVYGMGGVGKTTIMTHIYNELSQKKVYEIVIWVTVSSSFNLEKLQDNIAKLLGFEFSPSSNLSSRAQELHASFRRRRNFIIILDDIWKRVSLQNVGIPEPNRSNGSKVVWTTRFLDVCNSMESDREIKVEGLTDEEAWSLFKDKVGAEDVIMSTEIQPIAKQVAKECARLPLALITVGRALRKASQPSVWRNALQQLKTSRADQIHGMAEEVFGSLKFSYDCLSNDTIRACFLYCALYPEDDEIPVDELIEHWMAEGLINEKGSIQVDEDKGHAYLKELKDACMIESIADDNKSVRMHDLIRDLAIKITRGNPEQSLFMVKAGLGLTESPEEEEWVESLQRVSLMNNNIKAFRGQPNCPKLSTLLLHHNSGLITFSNTFFKHMHNLRVLNLSNTGINSLPDSISDLVNLQALFLKYCRQLEHLPSLAKLQNLQSLILSGCYGLKHSPSLATLHKLRRLELGRLYMHSSSWRFSTVGEIISFKKLTRFSADFADVLTFNSFIDWADEFELMKNFDYFLFTVSRKSDGHNAENESMEKVTSPGTANYLAVDSCNFIQLLNFFGSDKLRQLIDCRIQSCNEMEWIGKDAEIILPSLKRLILVDLPSFKGLCKEQAHEETFKSLAHLNIAYCHKLKYLIPIDLLVSNLQNLEAISIAHCDEMEDVISGKASSADMIILPKLKKLHLWDLPRLTSICQGKLVCDSLQHIDLIDCLKLKKLPFLINNEPSISPTIIGMSQEWWETLAWEDPQSKERLQPLFPSHSFMMKLKTAWRVNFAARRFIVAENIIEIAKFKFQDDKDWLSDD